jgi:hypothetical protein
LSLCLIKHHAMRELEVMLHAFLTSVLDGGKWSGSRFGRPTPVPMSRSGHSGTPCRESNPGRPACNRSLYWAIRFSLFIQLFVAHITTLSVAQTV